MRIFFIVDETSVFLPKWLDDSIQILGQTHEIVGITALISKHQTWESHIKSQLIHFPLLSLMKLFIFGIKISVGRILFSLGFKHTPHTITQVAQKHAIKTLNTTNVNDSTYLLRLKSLHPDIVVSSCSQIFKSKLLELPKVGCINRHSSLLPSYGGVLPVFWALLNNEKCIGVTIHWMSKEIDTGKIIYQEKIEVTKNNSLFDLYKKSYSISVHALSQAIDIISKKRKYVYIKKIHKSYFSFPTRMQINQFLQSERKFI